MITIADVADKAGVSRATVSHVLSQGQGKNVRISDATRLRVLETARVLGYRTNALARSVSLGKSHMLGYLVPEGRYEPYWLTLLGALSEAETLGFTLKVLSVRRENLSQRIQQCLELRLSGLIVRLNDDKSAVFEEANQARIPVVTVDEGVPQPFGIRVAADDAVGCREAISHLVELGHRCIGFISSGFPQQTVRANIGVIREGVFRQEMKARGLDVPDGFVTYESMWPYGSYAQAEIDVSSAVAATNALIDHPAGRPTAIFCWRDETAMLAIRVCRSHGLRVPEDISVVGFSDISTAQLFDPPLSTVKSPWDEMGRTSVRQLVRALDAEFDPSPQSFLIASQFVSRQSSGPISQ